jgi:polyphosphate kinase 2 (PPK2 family)
MNVLHGFSLRGCAVAVLRSLEEDGRRVLVVFENSDTGDKRGKVRRTHTACSVP